MVSMSEINKHFNTDPKKGDVKAFKSEFLILNQIMSELKKTPQDLEI
jgi:hypothetical protein